MSDPKKVTQLQAITQPPNARLIEYLENLMEDAKSGEVQGLAYVVVYNDGCVGHSWVNAVTAAALGELTAMHTSMAYQVAKDRHPEIFP